MVQNDDHHIHVSLIHTKPLIQRMNVFSAMSSVQNDSPDRRERQFGTLVRTVGAGAAPTVRTGQTVTRLMPCSSENLYASFSRSTFDTGYPCKHN